MKKNCVECGKEFETANERQIYCSKKCCDRVASRRFHAAQRAEAEVFSRVCPHCGKAFETTRPNKVYCSVECSTEVAAVAASKRGKARRAARQEARQAQGNRVCERCGARWYSRCGRGRYCPECRGLRLDVSSAEELLSDEQRRAVERAQDSGDRERLWHESQKWTKAQRAFAKRRYCEQYLSGYGRFIGGKN